MTKPTLWYWIAVGLSVFNVAGAGYAIAQVEPAHAAVHVVLAVAFGFWARRLQSRPGGSELEDRLEALEVEVSRLRQELSETHERLDFAERVLAQRPEPRRVGPER
jgi:hypothetical protein